MNDTEINYFRFLSTLFNLSRQVIYSTLIGGLRRKGLLCWVEEKPIDSHTCYTNGIILLDIISNDIIRYYMIRGFSMEEKTGIAAPLVFLEKEIYSFLKKALFFSVRINLYLHLRTCWRVKSSLSPLIVSGTIVSHIAFVAQFES